MTIPRIHGAEAPAALERGRHVPRRDRVRGLESSPLLAALVRAGTEHVYVDSADEDEIAPAITTAGGARLREIDGNTINQPLLAKVFDRRLEPLREWVRRLAGEERAVGAEDLPAWVYAVVSAGAGASIVERFGSGAAWDVSLQVHMRAARDRRSTVELGRWIHAAVPNALVKVPFLPHRPECILAARDLRNAGVPVNFTSTFSARQVAVAALLAEPARTNVFMGRLNQGLSATRLGEATCLAAQRVLTGLRRAHGVATQLIVASVRDWQTFAAVSGCDAFTAPAKAIKAFLDQDQVHPGDIESKLEVSYADELGVSPEVERRLPRGALERLFTVEPELVELAAELRASRSYQRLEDGDGLRQAFEEAGFGDFFHAPDEREWALIRAGKLPDLAAPLVERVALDTLFTLHADADFDAHQERMDAATRALLAG